MEDKKVIAQTTIPDYRVVRPMMFLEKGGDTIAAVQQLSACMVNGCKLSFITPNAVTLFYNKSFKEYERSQRIYAKLIKLNVTKATDYDIPLESLTELYDYFEHIQTSIITIYSAIEALCNLAIPANYTLTKNNSKGITEIWNKTNIEKWLSTEEKVGKIVPDILSIESPKTLPFWEHFKQLKQIRDDIIHQKQSPLNPNEIESNFLQNLLEESIFRKITAGFELIQYFCNKDKTHAYFPILSPEIPVNVTIVGSFAGTFTRHETPPNESLS